MDAGFCVRGVRAWNETSVDESAGSRPELRGGLPSLLQAERARIPGTSPRASLRSAQSWIGASF